METNPFKLLLRRPVCKDIQRQNWSWKCLLQTRNSQKERILITKEKRQKMNVNHIHPTCRAAFVGTRKVMWAGAPLKIPLTLASSSKEWDRIPPLYYKEYKKQSKIRLCKFNGGKCKVKEYYISNRQNSRIKLLPWLGEVTTDNVKDILRPAIISQTYIICGPEKEYSKREITCYR